MSTEMFHKKISEIIDHKNCGAEFFFLLSTADTSPMLRKVDLTTEADTELHDGFINALRKTVENTSPVPLSKADERVDGIYHYDMVLLPEPLLNLVNVLENDDFKLFDSSKDSLVALKSIIVLFGHGKKQLALYKHIYPIFVMKKSSGLFSCRSDGTRLEPLRHDILRINTTFEFMLIDGEFFVFDLKLLERSFGFQEIVKKIAAEELKKIAASNLVDDISELESRLNDITFTRKLAKAARNSPVLGSGIPLREIIAFTLSHPALQGKIPVNQKKDKLMLTTKIAQDAFLRLLNDDFLQSELTRRFYASITKDPA